jgi:hypothetical protein
MSRPWHQEPARVRAWRIPAFSEAGRELGIGPGTAFESITVPRACHFLRDRRGRGESPNRPRLGEATGVCAHDRGLILNPEMLRHTLECAMLHSVSRTVHEEVQFDTEKVTSVDWNSHPTLTHADVPARIDVVLVNGDPSPARPDLAPYGAGDTGVRIRRVPFREARA